MEKLDLTQTADESRSDVLAAGGRAPDPSPLNRSECSKSPAGAPLRSDRRKPTAWGLLGFAALIVFVMLCFLGLVKWGEGVSQRKTGGAAAQKGVFGKLGMEEPQKAALAPDFSLEDLSGRRVDLKSLRGKVVFLNFWATWCIPCREEMPTLEKLDRELKSKGLEIVAIDYQESPGEVRKFFAQHGFTFTALLDREGKVSNQYGTWSIPLSVFISRNGELVGKAVGSRKWDSPDARVFVRELLEGPS